MNELSKQLMCIALRNGVEIWVEKERIDSLIGELNSVSQRKFLEVDGGIINTADIVGVFTAEQMEGKTRRANGEWKCKRGTWHTKREICECKNTRKCQKCGKENPSNFVRSGTGIICADCFSGDYEPPKTISKDFKKIGE